MTHFVQIDTLAWSHTVAIQRLHSDGLYPVEDLGNSGVDPGVVRVATLDTLAHHANLNIPIKANE